MHDPYIFGDEPTHQRRGLARALLAAMLAHGRALGCAEAWVATEEGNAPARALYAAAGGVDADELFRMYTFPLAADDAAG
jgi:GNAT superfamily N-acetyltransferase